MKYEIVRMYTDPSLTFRGESITVDPESGVEFDGIWGDAAEVELDTLGQTEGVQIVVHFGAPRSRQMWLSSTPRGWDILKDVDTPEPIV